MGGVRALRRGAGGALPAVDRGVTRAAANGLPPDVAAIHTAESGGAFLPAWCPSLGADAGRRGPTPTPSGCGCSTPWLYLVPLGPQRVNAAADGPRRHALGRPLQLATPAPPRDVAPSDLPVGRSLRPTGTLMSWPPSSARSPFSLTSGACPGLNAWLVGGRDARRRSSTSSSIGPAWGSTVEGAGAPWRYWLEARDRRQSVLHRSGGQPLARIGSRL